jgi:hypothetical protein
MEQLSKITITQKQSKELQNIHRDIEKSQYPDVEITGEVRLAMEVLRKFNEDRLLAYLASLEEEQTNDDKFENNKIPNQTLFTDE